MKLGAIILLTSLTAFSQSHLDRMGFVVNNHSRQLTPAEIAAEKRAKSDYFKKFVPHDPWRVVDGKPAVYAKGTNWFQFVGKIINVHPDGITLYGWYYTPGYANVLLPEQTFFVKNFPYPVADGDYINNTTHYCATPAGTYSYKSAFGDRTTLHSLDYGKPVPIPTLKPAGQVTNTTLLKTNPPVPVSP
jgi:hypothetical protein